MVKKEDNDKKIVESKTSTQIIQDGLEANIKRIHNITTALPKDEAIKAIENLRDSDKKEGNSQYFLVYRYTLDLLNGKIDEEKYNKLNKDFVKDECKNIDNILGCIVELGEKNITKDEIIKEVKSKYPKISNKKLDEYIDLLMNSHYEKEVLNERENEASFSERSERENEANLSQEVTDNPEANSEVVDPYKLDRPDQENIKKIYKYKVEGKITSGIPELDQFLEIIQPALNQLIIIPWKFVYGALDKKNLALDKYKAYQTQQKNVDSIMKTLGKMDGAIPAGDDFKPGWNLKKNQDQVAGYFNKYLCDKLNEELDKKQVQDKEKEINDILEYNKGMTRAEAEAQADQNYEEKIAKIMTQINYATGQNYTRDEAEKKANENYEHRTKFFDFSKESDTPRKVLTQEFVNLIRKCRIDGKGKIDEDGQGLLKGFAAAVDLFNLKNKDTIPTYYSDAIKYILENIESPTRGGGYIEDDIQKIFDDMEEEKNSNKLETLLEKKIQQGKS